MSRFIRVCISFIFMFYYKKNKSKSAQYKKIIIPDILTSKTESAEWKMLTMLSDFKSQNIKKVCKNKYDFLLQICALQK